MAMVIPKDFSHYIESGKTAPLQLIVDGSDANTATIAMGYVRSVVSNYNVNLLTNALAHYGMSRISSIDALSVGWITVMV